MSLTSEHPFFFVLGAYPINMKSSWAKIKSAFLMMQRTAPSQF